MKNIIEDIKERRKWGDPVLRVFIIGISAIVIVVLILGYLNWQTTGTAQSLRDENEVLSADKESLLADNESLREESETLREESETLRADNETLITERDMARSELAAADTRIGELEGELDTVTQERDDVVAELAAANTRISELEGELDTVTQERDDAIAELATVNQEIEEANTRIGELEEERDTLLADNETLRAEIETLKKDRIIVYGSQTLAEQVELDMIQGNTSSDENALLLLLRGDLINRPPPGVDVYRSIGTIALPPGNWAFAEKGIGGERATGAGNSALRWEAVPAACVEDPAGSWYDAIQATCEVNIEWTVNSRYPLANLLILPINSLIPSEDE